MPIATAARPPTGAYRTWAAPAVEEEEAPVDEPVLNAPVEAELEPEVVAVPAEALDCIVVAEVWEPPVALVVEDWMPAALHQEVSWLLAATRAGSPGQLL